MHQLLKVLQEIKNEIEESHLLNKEVFSLKQFCRYADISEDQGYKLTSERKIKFYRPGGKKIYIDKEDALAYLRQNPVSSLTASDQTLTRYLFTSKNNKYGNF